MYQMSYAETLEDSARDRRGQEREVFSLAIEQLKAAGQAGVQSDEAVKALTTLVRLWSLLINDLGSAENSLPEQLRADLISIGLWTLKQADAIRTGSSEDFQSLIEINEMICKGLS